MVKWFVMIHLLMKWRQKTQRDLFTTFNVAWETRWTEQVREEDYDDDDDDGDNDSHQNDNRIYWIGDQSICGVCVCVEMLGIFCVQHYTWIHFAFLCTLYIISCKQTWSYRIFRMNNFFFFDKLIIIIFNGYVWLCVL